MDSEWLSTWQGGEGEGETKHNMGHMRHFSYPVKLPFVQPPISSLPNFLGMRVTVNSQKYQGHSNRPSGISIIHSAVLAQKRQAVYLLNQVREG